jgi:hypothetical protein
MRYWARRVVLVTAVVASLTMVVRAYDDPHRVFGFQMFPEASSWQATVYRVTADGIRVDVREPWPGGYRWSQLVEGRGLEAPYVERHASYGVGATLSYMQYALDYVAANTPADRETVRLEADVIYRRNGGAPRHVRLASRARGEAS